MPAIDVERVAPTAPLATSTLGPSSGMTAAELRQLKQEKRELKKKLCAYQAKFRETFQRDVLSKKVTRIVAFTPHPPMLQYFHFVPSGSRTHEC